jgi:hypothetical protein
VAEYRIQGAQVCRRVGSNGILQMEDRRPNTLSQSAACGLSQIPKFQRAFGSRAIGHMPALAMAIE